MATKKTSGASRSRTDGQSPPVSETELERRHARAIMALGVCGSLVKIGIIGVTVVGSCYCIFALPVMYSQGQVTAISHVVNILVNSKMDVLISWGATAAASVWAVKERRQRMKDRDAKDRRIKDLESAFDPQRESSNLDVTGTRIKKGTAS